MTAATMPSASRAGGTLPRWRVLRRLVYLAAMGAVLAVVGLRLVTVLYYRDAVYQPAAAPAGRVAIVFGAGVLPDSSPTDVLYDRVATAAELYRLGKVERVLLSGDGRPGSAHEPEVMRRAAIALGVPDEALVLDNAGLRTYDSCERARSIYGVRRALLVTQSFHLPRALLLCDALGIDAAGVSGDRRPYPWRWRLGWQAREVGATAVAWWDVAGGRRLMAMLHR